MKKFRAVLQHSCVFVIPSKSEESNGVLDIEAVEKESFRNVGDLLDRGYGANSLSSINFTYENAKECIESWAAEDEIPIDKGISIEPNALQDEVDDSIAEVLHNEDDRCLESDIFESIKLDDTATVGLVDATTDITFAAGKVAPASAPKNPVRRRNSFLNKRKRLRTISGPVALSDEEAFYLCMNGHLSVFRSVQQDSSSEEGQLVVGLEELWTTLCAKNSKFPAKYKVYSFFRDQRFVVRSGMHFGVDLAVYRLLPTHCHSEMCVAVVDQTAGQPGVGSRHLSTLTRVMPDVMKLLLLCFVLPAERPAPAEGEKEGEEDDRSAYLQRLFPHRLQCNHSSSNSSNDSSISSGHGISRSGSGSVDCSSYRCLERLTVRPVTVIVRRSSATSKGFASASALQQRYRRVSVLKKPRLFPTSRPAAAAPAAPAEARGAGEGQSLLSLTAAAPTAEGGAVGGGAAESSSSLARPPQKRRRDPQEVRCKAASKSNQLWAALAADEPPELSPKSKKRAKKRKWLIKMFGHSK